MLRNTLNTFITATFIMLLGVSSTAQAIVPMGDLMGSTSVTFTGQAEATTYPSAIRVDLVPAESTIREHGGLGDREVEGNKVTVTYTITSDISSMGYKLQGRAINTTQQGIISEGISFGAVQIPPDGQPIILLKTRQTIGGYPKMGAIFPTDCFTLAQLPIGAKVQFEPITLEAAQEEMKAFYELFNR